MNPSYKINNVTEVDSKRPNQSRPENILILSKVCIHQAIRFYRFFSHFENHIWISRLQNWIYLLQAIKYVTWRPESLHILHGFVDDNLSFFCDWYEEEFSKLRKSNWFDIAQCFKAKVFVPQRGEIWREITHRCAQNYLVKCKDIISVCLRDCNCLLVFSPFQSLCKIKSVVLNAQA
jgi:hypothetical protein